MASQTPFRIESQADEELDTLLDAFVGVDYITSEEATRVRARRRAGKAPYFVARVAGTHPAAHIRALRNADTSAFPENYLLKACLRSGAIQHADYDQFVTAVLERRMITEALYRSEQYLSPEASPAAQRMRQRAASPAKSALKRNQVPGDPARETPPVQTPPVQTPQEVPPLFPAWQGPIPLSPISQPLDTASEIPQPRQRRSSFLQDSGVPPPPPEILAPLDEILTETPRQPQQGPTSAPRPLGEQAPAENQQQQDFNDNLSIARATSEEFSPEPEFDGVSDSPEDTTPGYPFSEALQALPDQYFPHQLYGYSGPQWVRETPRVDLKNNGQWFNRLNEKTTGATGLDDMPPLPHLPLLPAPFDPFSPKLFAGGDRLDKLTAKLPSHGRSAIQDTISKETQDAFADNAREMHQLFKDIDEGFAITPQGYVPRYDDKTLLLETDYMDDDDEYLVQTFANPPRGNPIVSAGGKNVTTGQLLETEQNSQQEQIHPIVEGGVVTPRKGSGHALPPGSSPGFPVDQNGPTTNAADASPRKRQPKTPVRDPGLRYPHRGNVSPGKRPGDVIPTGSGTTSYLACAATASPKKRRSETPARESGHGNPVDRDPPTGDGGSASPRKRPGSTPVADRSPGVPLNWNLPISKGVAMSPRKRPGSVLNREDASVSSTRPMGVVADDDSFLNDVSEKTRYDVKAAPRKIPGAQDHSVLIPTREKTPAADRMIDSGRTAAKDDSDLVSVNQFTTRQDTWALLEHILRHREREETVLSRETKGIHQTALDIDTPQISKDSSTERPLPKSPRRRVNPGGNSSATSISPEEDGLQTSMGLRRDSSKLDGQAKIPLLVVTSPKKTIRPEDASTVTEEPSIWKDLVEGNPRLERSLGFTRWKPTVRKPCTSERNGDKVKGDGVWIDLTNEPEESSSEELFSEEESPDQKLSASFTRWKPTEMIPDSDIQEDDVMESDDFNQLLDDLVESEQEADTQRKKPTEKTASTNNEDGDIPEKESSEQEAGMNLIGKKPTGRKGNMDQTVRDDDEVNDSYQYPDDTDDPDDPERPSGPSVAATTLGNGDFRICFRANLQQRDDGSVSDGDSDGDSDDQEHSSHASTDEIGGNNMEVDHFDQPPADLDDPVNSDDLESPSGPSVTTTTLRNDDVRLSFRATFKHLDDESDDESINAGDCDDQEFDPDPRRGGQQDHALIHANDAENDDAKSEDDKVEDGNDAAARTSRQSTGQSPKRAQADVIGTTASPGAVDGADASTSMTTGQQAKSCRRITRSKPVAGLQTNTPQSEHSGLQNRTPHAEHVDLDADYLLPSNEEEVEDEQQQQQQQQQKTPPYTPVPERTARDRKRKATSDPAEAPASKAANVEGTKSPGKRGRPRKAIATANAPAPDEDGGEEEEEEDLNVAKENEATKTITTATSRNAQAQARKRTTRASSAAQTTGNDYMDVVEEDMALDEEEGLGVLKQRKTTVAATSKNVHAQARKRNTRASSAAQANGSDEVEDEEESQAQVEDEDQADENQKRPSARARHAHTNTKKDEEVRDDDDEGGEDQNESVETVPKKAKTPSTAKSAGATRTTSAASSRGRRGNASGEAEDEADEMGGDDEVIDDAPKKAKTSSTARKSSKAIETTSAASSRGRSRNASGEADGEGDETGYDNDNDNEEEEDENEGVNTATKQGKTRRTARKTGKATQTLAPARGRGRPRRNASGNAERVDGDDNDDRAVEGSARMPKKASTATKRNSTRAKKNVNYANATAATPSSRKRRGRTAAAAEPGEPDIIDNGAATVSGRRMRNFA